MIGFLMPIQNSSNSNSFPSGIILFAYEIRFLSRIRPDFNHMPNPFFGEVFFCHMNKLNKCVTYSYLFDCILLHVFYVNENEIENENVK